MKKKQKKDPFRRKNLKREKFLRQKHYCPDRFDRLKEETDKV
jgi:hypothetical protein